MNNQVFDVLCHPSPVACVYVYFLLVDSNPCTSNIPIGNSETLNKIHTAWFALCLDDCVATDAISLARNLLHGDGKNRSRLIFGVG